MRLILEFNRNRKPKKVKSIYPDIEYLLVSRETGKVIEIIWKEEF